MKRRSASRRSSPTSSCRRSRNSPDFRCRSNAERPPASDSEVKGAHRCRCRRAAEPLSRPSPRDLRRLSSYIEDSDMDANTTPRTQDFIGKEARFGARNYQPVPVVVDHARDCLVWDVEGREYIDMMSAYSAVSHG